MLDEISQELTKLGQFCNRGRAYNADVIVVVFEQAKNLRDENRNGKKQFSLR